MTIKLTHLQSLLSVRLEVAFKRDTFTGLLNEATIRGLADGLAAAVPMDRLATKERSAKDAASYLKPYIGRTWDYFPFAALFTDPFKAYVLGLVAAEVVGLAQDHVANGNSESLATRLDSPV